MIIYQGQQCMSILINLFMHFFIHLERIFCVRAAMDTFHRRTGLGFVRVFTLIINKKSCNNVNLTLLICIKVNIQRKNYKWIWQWCYWRQGGWILMIMVRIRFNCFEKSTDSSLIHWLLAWHTPKGGVIFHSEPILLWLQVVLLLGKMESD